MYHEYKFSTKFNKIPNRNQANKILFYVIFITTQKTERWEKFANAAQDGTDQFYDWEKSRSRKSLGNYKLKGRGEQVKRYSEAVVAVKLEPKPLEKYNFSSSRRKIVDEYKESVLGLLDLKKLQWAPLKWSHDSLNYCVIFKRPYISIDKLKSKNKC